MYRVIVSSELTRLATHLADRLPELQSADPLRPFTILVPNRDTARWLTLQVARKNGVAANLSFILPSQWAWTLIRQYRADLPDVLPSDAGPLCWTLCEWMKSAEGMRELDPVRNWLNTQSGQQPERVWGLARSIAAVYDQYQVYRPRMLRQWEQGGFGSFGEHPSEEWQAVLWRRLTRYWKETHGDKLQHRGALFLQLEELVRDQKLTLIKPIMLFNPGLIPAPFTRSLAAASGQIDLFHYQVCSSVVYTMSGHREPFEASRQVVSATDESVIRPSEIENSLLAHLSEEQWMQMESIRSAAIADGYPVTEEWIPATEPRQHLLGKVQYSLLHGVSIEGVGACVGAEGEGAGKDSSIVIKSCHHPKREVETLYQFLLEAFEADPDLKPDDIAIVTPDPDSYLPYLMSVFSTAEEGLPVIPLYQPGGMRRRENRAFTAFEDLLRLAKARLRRDEVIDFAAHEAVSNRFEWTKSDLSLVQHWFEENMATWGADDGHRQQFGQPEGSEQTWERAMARGWLGQLGSSSAGELWGDLLLYRDVESTEHRELWARFHRLIRYLHEFSNKCSEEKTSAEWAQLLIAAVDRFLSGEESEEEEISSLKESIQAITEEMGAGEASGQSRWPLSLIAKRFKQELDRRSGGTALFTGGVVVHSMVPLRSIPFKIIALVGLNEESYPRKPDSSSFDLMSSERMAGERDHRREDRNLFLESIMAARDCLYASYTGRSQKDDEELPPSVILQEWIDQVRKVSNDGNGEIVSRETLNSFSARQFSADMPISFSLIQRRVRERLNRPGRRGFATPADVYSDEESAQTSGQTGVGEHTNFSSESIRLSDIERFFRNPSSFYLNHQLGIYLRDYRKMATDEFSPDGLERYLHFRRLFEWTLMEKKADQMFRLLKSSAALPDGWSGERVIHSLIDRAGKAVGALAERGIDADSKRINIDLMAGGVRITGGIQTFSRNGFLDLHPSRLSGKWFLGSWIRHLLLCASGWMDETGKGLVYSGFSSANNKNHQWLELPYIPESESVLDELIALYQKGINVPQHYYLDSGFVFAREHFLEDKPEKGALDKARSKWEGGYRQRAERESGSIRVLWGDQAPFDPDRVIQYANILYRTGLTRGRIV